MSLQARDWWPGGQQGQVRQRDRVFLSELCVSGGPFPKMGPRRCPKKGLRGGGGRAYARGGCLFFYLLTEVIMFKEDVFFDSGGVAMGQFWPLP